MTVFSLSQPGRALQLMLQPGLLTQWLLRMAIVAALFAGLQAVSEFFGTTQSWFLFGCNLFICLGVFNLICLNVQQATITMQDSRPMETTSTTCLTCFLPLLWAVGFYILLGCFIVLDWIPYVGTGLSVVLTPFFFLLAAMPPISVLIQLMLPLFVLPYLASARESGMLMAVANARTLLQQPLKHLGNLLLAYAPLVLTLLLLLASWGTIWTLQRLSPNWSVALLQKSLLIILSGMCLAPATLFVVMMGATQILDANTQQKRSKMNQGR